MKMSMILAPVIMAVGMACHAGAQETPAMGHSDDLIIKAVRNGQKTLTVSSPGFREQQDIPLKYTQYGENLFPGVRWSKGPAMTKSYLVVMQGAPDRPAARTSIHVVVFNIPARQRHLEPGITTPPAGAIFGPNVHGLNQPYAGPHTHTLARQAYHLQVLALDITLPADPDIRFETIEAATKTHVLAAGDLTGFAAMDPQSPEAAKLLQQAPIGK